MAKYNVKHTCGCEIEHTLYGKTSYREYKIEQFKSEKCYNCIQQDKVNEMLNSGNYEVIEVHYSEYKNSDIDYVAVPNTYNKDTKTIKVLAKIEKTEEKVIEEIEKIIVNKVNNDGKTILNKDDAKKLNDKIANDAKLFNLDLTKLNKLFKNMTDSFKMVWDKVKNVVILTVNNIKKSYNKSEIMKNAWAMYKSQKATGITFSECLKNAWALAR